jgi:MFS family permease
LRELAAPAWQVGVFTTILLLGQIVGNVALGWLADHTGHLIAVIAGVVAIIAGNLIALLAPSVETFSLAFAMNGIYLAANNVSGMNVMLEFAPTVDERPTYLGLGNTAIGPVAFVAPLLGGVMADTIGFGPVFILSALFGLASLGVMLLRVQDPRHQARST